MRTDGKWLDHRTLLAMARVKDLTIHLVGGQVNEEQPIGNGDIHITITFLSECHYDATKPVAAFLIPEVAKTMTAIELLWGHCLILKPLKDHTEMELKSAFLKCARKLGSRTKASDGLNLLLKRKGLPVSVAGY
jgi:hypothetical protein